MTLTNNTVPKATGANTIADGYTVVTTVGDPGADTKFATEQAIREAIAAIPRVLIKRVFPEDTAVTTGDGKAYITLPSLLDGYNLTEAHAHVDTVSSSGLPTVQIHNLTQTADMLATRITVDENEDDSKDAAAAPVIDTGNDDVADGDVIRIDVDVAGTGTKGLEVRMQFEKA